MDFSNLRINPNRVSKIFVNNSHGVTNTEAERIEVLQAKEKSGVLTPGEYERLDFLEEKNKYSALHTVGKGAQAYLLYIFSIKKYGMPAKVHGNSVGQQSAPNGILKEPKVIELLENFRGITLYRSKVRIKNDYLIGIPDAFDDEDWERSKMVHEIKTTSNRVQFLHKKIYPFTFHNYLQIQGYMALTGKKMAAIHHCLVDYHEDIILSERDRMFRYFCPDGYETARFLEEWRLKEGQLRFSGMPEDQRVFTCFIDRDERVIEKIYKKVKVCREWLNNYSILDKEIESTGTTNIQKNSFLKLRQKLGLE